MKLHLLYAIGLTFLFQKGYGRFLETSNKEIDSSWLESYKELSEKLNEQIAELEIKKDELNNHKKELYHKLEHTEEKCKTELLMNHAVLFSNWDLEGCLNLTGDGKDGLLLIIKVTIESWNITETLRTAINDIMTECAKESWYKELDCYFHSAVTLKDDIEALKKDLKPFIQEGKEIVKNMKKDLDSCLGIPYALKNQIERHLEKCSYVI